jgi:hypothetical protein
VQAIVSQLEVVIKNEEKAKDIEKDEREYYLNTCAN